MSGQETPEGSMTDLMTRGMITGSGYLNGEGPWPCQLRIDVERIDISTNLPKADTNWSFTDSAGHFHAYNQAADGQHERYPTLYTRIEEVPCDHADHDGDCDGANITHWHCMVCDEEIKPRKIPGPHYESMDGLRSWEARIQVPAERAFKLTGEKVILTLEDTDDRMTFGAGFVLGNYSYASGDTSITLTVAGTGPLGHRKVKS